jgi:hypothetical protein
MASKLEQALAAIPAGLRKPLISIFEDLLSEYRAGDWEKVGLKAGKICEIVYTILNGYTSGSYATAPSKPSNMVSACTSLEAVGSHFSRSVRIQIPRVLIALYELRNNRAIGHVSGDLDPNHMDAEFFLRGCKWVMGELIRLFASLPPNEARELLEEVTARTLPAVWETGSGKKLLNPKLGTPDKALVLAYSCPGGATARELCEWIGYGNLSRFRNNILAGLDADALINFNRNTDVVTVSPTGIRKVEGTGLLELR